MAEYSFVSPSYDEIHNACVDLVAKIKKEQPNVEMIAGVARGGLLPAMIISHLLERPMISFSYSSKHGKGDDKNHMNNLPLIDPLEGSLLIVDDIADSGQTLNEIVFHFNRQKVMTTTCVLFYRNHPGQVMIPDFFWRSVSEKDGWITFPFERGSKL